MIGWHAKRPSEFGENEASQVRTGKNFKKSFSCGLREIRAIRGPKKWPRIARISQIFRGETLRDRGGKIRFAHQKLIDASGGASTFGNGPDDKRLSALHVTCGKNPGDIGHPALVTSDI